MSIRDDWDSLLARVRRSTAMRNLDAARPGIQDEPPSREAWKAYARAAREFRAFHGARADMNYSLRAKQNEARARRRGDGRDAE
jgi:hypothetical protein